MNKWHAVKNDMILYSSSDYKEVKSFIRIYQEFYPNNDVKLVRFIEVKR